MTVAMNSRAAHIRRLMANVGTEPGGCAGAPPSPRFLRLRWDGLRLLRGLSLLALLALAASCGYHSSGASSVLPPDVKTLAIPSFQNQTHTYHLETGLTGAVIREFNTRTRYRIVQSGAPATMPPAAQTAAPSASQADATLLGTVVSAQVAPVAYDSVTGRASTGLVTIVVKVTLTARDGRVLYSNPNYVFRDQYQVSNELASFFEEQGPALDRLEGDFSRTLVSNILEAF
jgi:outer membrane lipopolysaccharide assembly protein LptE/RlpB